MTKQNTQIDKIKAALLNNEPLTSVTAFEKHHITRLSAIILRLRQKSWPIVTIKAKKNGPATYSLLKNWNPDR